MLELQRDSRFIIDDVLVQYHIMSVKKPLLIMFAPAGHVLTGREDKEGCSAWDFEFNKAM